MRKNDDTSIDAYDIVACVVEAVSEIPMEKFSLVNEFKEHTGDPNKFLTPNRMQIIETEATKIVENVLEDKGCKLLKIIHFRPKPSISQYNGTDFVVVWSTIKVKRRKGEQLNGLKFGNDLKDCYIDCR